MLLIPPAPPVLDELLIEIRAAAQEHASNGALVLVAGMRLDSDFLAEDQFRGSVLGALAKSPALLRAGDAVETDTVSLVIDQDFDS
jgi:hypothetical protein